MLRYVRHLAVACALVLVSACTTLQNPLTPTRLAAIESSYGIALSAAVGYRNACARKALPSSCRGIVAHMQSASRVAQARVLELRAFVRNNPELDAGALIAAAQSSVQAFRDIQAVYGVGTGAQ